MSENNSMAVPGLQRGTGSSPFDQIRHVDAFGREYWLGRELMPLMGYTRWENFAEALDRAMISTQNIGQDPDKHFSRHHEKTGGRGRPPVDYRMTRFGCYVAAQNGDPRKPEVAAAQGYFAVRAREAELGALTVEELRQTALARAREMTDYKIFRDMMVEIATDYVPSTKASRIFFGTMQNKLYRHITGMSAPEIKNAREICHWKGRETGKLEPTKKDRGAAKNYLAVGELNKLDRLVSRLCLRAEDIADDGLNLTLAAWEDLVDAELSVATPRPAMTGS